METQAIIEMLKKQEKSLIKIERGLSAPQPQQPTIDHARVEALTEQLQTAVDKTGEVIDAVRKPIIKQSKFSVSIESKSILCYILFSFLTIIGLATKYFIDTEPNYDQRDNDIKYRYIKMKGEATPKTITELENLFELNRDNKRIREIWQTIKEYEETIRQKAIVEEHARRKLIEAEKLNKEIDGLKNR